MPGKRLTFDEQLQQQSNWCWAATGTSVALFYDASPAWTQCTLADAALGFGGCCAAPNGWQLQQLTGGVLTPGPTAVGGPCVAVYDGQMHVCYRSQFSTIQDAWFDGSHWNLQEIGGPAGVVSSPLAAGDPAVAVYDGQMHICYCDAAQGNVQDVWWDGSHWNLQEISGPSGVAISPLAVGKPSVAVYDGQMHVCYRDATQGEVQDVFFNGQSCNISYYLDDVLSITEHLARYFSSSVSFSVVQDAINGNCPIGIRLGWNTRGGHFPVITGWAEIGNDELVDIDDPIFGFSTQTFSTFPAYYHGGATWTSTCFTKP